ncbi:MAG: aldehyde ferredoxin oxidoreductase family protein [Chloroflexota bacterium]|jgi:aldehyde:ferredoxin oxidoreductase
MHGWMGKILFVDLATGNSRVEPLDEELAESYLGGRGLGIRYLFDRVPGRAEPLGPENILVFAAGPLTGTPAPTAGRFSLTTLSPLTGTAFDSNSGGRWGPMLKTTGFDAVVVEGAADRPVVLEIQDGKAQLSEAGDLWGATVPQTTESLGGKGKSVACIGPAGERLVRLAAIVNDGTRALARGGIGAVMGSKKLKAVVVSGSARPSIADPEGFEFVRYEAEKQLKANPITARGLPEFGTAVLINILNEAAALPTRNYQTNRFDSAEKISGEALKDSFVTGKRGCWGCPIACTRRTQVGELQCEGPEYETLWALGADCEVADLREIVLANYLCNELGIDTISAGATIACAMELAERGLLPDGPRFGDAGCLLPLIKAMAYREGLGDELAEGSARLAARYGSPELSMQVKGMEIPAYDPRAMQSQGLAYATSNRGGCHLRANMMGPTILGLPKLVDRLNGRGQAGLAIEIQNLNAVLDSLVLCKFGHMGLGEDHYARLLSTVTGHFYSEADMLKVGERIWNLERLYNLRRGFTARDDTLPRRLLEEPASVGPAKGRVVELAPMLEEYYRFRGWTRDGVPTERKLADLGLVADGAEVRTC